MILRRRTYGHFTAKYGYFMRNSNFFETTDTESNFNTYAQSQTLNDVNAPQYIYTKCNQEEAPVGVFPTSNRTADAVSVKTLGSSTVYKGTFAVGYTLSSTTIIVFTPKHIYKSTDRGSTFSEVSCNTYTNSAPMTYRYELFTPVVWGNSSKYCILQAFVSGNYAYVYLFTYTVSSGTGVWKLLYSGLMASSHCLDTTAGAFYALRVSPVGQTLVLTHLNNNNLGYRLVDLNTGYYSNYWSNSGYAFGSTMPNYSGAGLWYNDGTTYGAFLVEAFKSNYHQYYKFSAISLTANGTQEVTATDITTSVLAIKDATENLDSSLKNNISIVIGSSNGSTTNLIVHATRESRHGTFFITNNSFSILKNLGNVADIPEFLSTFGTNDTWPSGLYVTHDGKWGIVLGTCVNVVFDMNALTFKSLANFIPMNGDLKMTYKLYYHGFMLPRYAV